MANDDRWSDADRWRRWRAERSGWSDPRSEYEDYGRGSAGDEPMFRGGGYGEYDQGGRGDSGYGRGGYEGRDRRDDRSYADDGFRRSSQGYGAAYGERFGQGRPTPRGDDSRRYGYGRDPSPSYGSGGYGGGYRQGSPYGYGGGGSGYGSFDRGRDDDGGERRGWWDRTSDEVSSWFGDEDADRRRRMDAEREGQHRGRGPKNYARSDDRIREDVCDRLSDDSRVDASEVHVSVANREVTLSGTVDSREARRRAEDCAESISGVTHVQNNLRVAQPGAGTSATSSASSTSALGAASRPAASSNGAAMSSGPTSTSASSAPPHAA